MGWEEIASGAGQEKWKVRCDVERLGLRGGGLGPLRIKSPARGDCARR